MSKKNIRLSVCWSILLLLVISTPAFAQYRDSLGGNWNNPASAMITNIIMDRYAQRRLEKNLAAKRSGASSTTSIFKAQNSPLEKRIKLVRGHKLVLKGEVYEGDDLYYNFKARQGQNLTVKLIGRDAAFTIN